MPTRSQNLVVAYRGPSAMGGHPIMAVVYCLPNGSRNKKTGPMAQVLICPADTVPYVAVKTGEDVSVCGNCPLRPVSGGGCYCNLGKFFPKVWEVAKGLPHDLDAACTAIRHSGLPVRVGSWGDPAAVPVEVIRSLVDAARRPDGKSRHTTYTTQWRQRPDLRDIAMASVYSQVDQREAARAGWRTARVRIAGTPLLHGEIVCAATKETGYKTTCSECLMCSGTGQKGPNVSFKLHGSSHKVAAVHRVIERLESGAVSTAHVATSHGHHALLH